MYYLTEGEVIELHDDIVYLTGGRRGIHDRHLLKSALERPKTITYGHVRYRSVFAKAAALLEAIANHHVFNDGNKRTSVAVAARFLALNGYELQITNKEYESYILRVVNKKPSVRAIARWLKKHSLPV